MAEPLTLEDLPQALLDPPRRRRLPAVWIIPILAALVAGGIAIQRIMTEGPTISILFHQGNGIEAGKTLVKYKDVNIGRVQKVQLAPGFAQVEVTVQIDASAGGLMAEDTQFWVVEPRVTLSGVSGLSTLLSGNYIGLQPGRSTKPRRRFTGLDAPPAITDQPGRRFLLKATDLGSLGIGAPIYYRRINVGEIADYALAKDGSGIDVTVFIGTPYERFVTPQTRFWDASGIDVSLNAEGLDVRTQSLVSLLTGGLAFDTPDFAPVEGAAAENTWFTLYPDQTTAMKQPDPIARHYVLFTESADGLAVGAPVKLLGLSAGEVTDVGIALDPKTQAFRPRVLITFFPERLIARLTPEQAALGQAMIEEDQAGHLRIIRHQIEDLGLRAQIRSGNLLTGENYVAFDYHPTAPRPVVDWSQDPLELPVVPGGLADIEDRVTTVLGQLDAILVKVDRLPLDAFGQDLSKILKSVDQLLRNADAKALPALTQTLDDLSKTLSTANRLFKDTNATLLGEDAPGQLELRNALQEVARAARAVRGLANELERHPEALIRGKTGGVQ